MLTFPNAKINIGLNIIEKRLDGFHNIESIFYPVEWCDVLEIIPSQENEFKFQSSGLTIPGSESSNLCLKAWKLLEAHISVPPTIHLHKVIPMGAGLGGGSADGAFTLKILNDVYDLKLKLSEYLSVKLNYEYHYLSNVFSELEGTTIEKYFILLKEKLKPPV